MISVKNTIDKFNLIKKGDIIGCAVSGGSDSMALLNFILSLKDEYGFELVCVNIEHGIRGKESVCDTLFVKNFCLEKGIKFFGKSVDALKYSQEKNCNLEQSARGLRYDFFYSLINDRICSKIFVAHNKKDNVETIFLNILRGCGASGVYGMDIDNGRGIIRPMIYTDKSEIMKYIEDNNIKYISDSTNSDNKYARNYLRNEIFPLFEGKFNNFYDNILRFSDIIKEESGYLNSLCEELIKTEGSGCYITLPCDKVLLKRAAIICCKKLGGVKDIESVHLNAVADLADKKSGSLLNLSNEINVYKDYQSIYFEKISKTLYNENIGIPFRAGTVEIGGFIFDISIEKNILKRENTFYIDAEKVDSSCVFRFRQKGDSFKRFKGSRKSLSDYFTDIKVPKRLRDSLPLLCRGNDVLIAFTYDICDAIKVMENTKNIYKISYRRINQ